MVISVLNHKQTVKQQDSIYTSFDDLPLYEQRYLPRWEVSNQAYYHSDPHHIFKTFTKNVSLTGACLYVTPHIHLNTKLELKIYLTPEKNFETKGTVLWKCTLNDDCCYAGIYFNPLPDQIRELILEHAFKRYCQMLWAEFLG